MTQRFIIFFADIKGFSFPWLHTLQYGPLDTAVVYLRCFKNKPAEADREKSL